MNISRSIVAIFLLIPAFSKAQQIVSPEEAVSIALQKNFDVRISENTLAGAEVGVNNSVGLFLPDLTLTASRMWNKNDQRQILADNSERGANGIPSKNLSSSVQMSWTLFDGLKMFATRNRLTEIEHQGEDLVKAQMNTTIANVISAYYSIVREMQQLKAINEQISVGEERIKLAERQLQVGTGVKTVLLQAKVDLNAFKVAALAQEALIEQRKEELNQLLAVSLPENFEVSDTILLNLNLTREEILDGMEQTNPQLLAARRNVAIARYALKERKGERLPIVNFVGNYNFSRTINTVVINNFTTLFNQNKGFNYGFTASLPILNNLVARNAVQLASITIRQQELAYEQLKAQSVIGVRIAYINYDNARKVLAIEEENVLFARENVSILLESFKRGVATFIELRTAQQTMVDAYSRLTTARYNAKVSETELLRLKGALLR
jgi:outer membrane protein TolC